MGDIRCVFVFVSLQGSIRLSLPLTKVFFRVRGMEKHRDRVVRERGREREREEKRQEEMEREEGRQRVEKRKMKEARKRSAAEDNKKKALVAAALAEAENVCHNHSGLPGHPTVLGVLHCDKVWYSVNNVLHCDAASVVCSVT